MFGKVLVANRGEIAVRVMRTLREMGIRTVAVFSEADRRALHVRYADEAYCIGPAPSRESYLRADRILEVARACGAEAIHPGYGFLSENASFAEACQEAGVVFIGPGADAMRAMGEKTGARRRMIAAGVPVVPGAEHPIPDPADALVLAREMGFPVLVKAAAGGGGKGMRRVDREEDFLDAFAGAQREAASAFGDASCYVEKWIVRPKHVEIQVLFDGHGNGVHLFERECSVQRRHQKVVEESPCPVLRDDVRQAMGRIAVQAGRAVDYVNAGTVEFLIDEAQNFYFLEMNTRLQVEHPVTELVTGIDLVQQQVRIAAGYPLSFGQADLRQRGHAIEVRVYAENPDQNFMPSPGPISRIRVPTGPGVRDDSGYTSGSEVSVWYDPMISKFIVWGEDREKARARMLRALDEYVVEGIETNISFLRDCLEYPEFVDGTFDTGVVAGILRAREARRSERSEPTTDGIIAAVLATHMQRAEHADRAQSTGGDAAGAGAWSEWRRYGLGRQVTRL